MSRSALFLAALFAACAAPAPADDSSPADLPIGDQLPDDQKADGVWGAALTCKPVPNLPSLVAPRITISLDGLTLHLTDAATGYDQVFPIGPGAIESGTTDAAYRESKSYWPIIATGSNDFAIRSADIQPCKSWWTDPDTGAKSPVFAGLPFMPWYGAFAVHGPIDNFRAPNGGNLRRGFVSHGCIRMEAADVLEVYARIRSVKSTPVHVQREPERDRSGGKVDLAARFIGAECHSDGECNYAGGFCKANKFSERGFCSARCTTTCADRAGQPTTFCVADPDAPTLGMCVAQVLPQDQDCRPYDHLVATPATRFKQTAHATVCLPGSPGWVGDHCFVDHDCEAGNRCAGATASAPGLCTQSCARYCPDQPGWASTFCAQNGACARECTLASNASECPGGTVCADTNRPNDPSSHRTVCTAE